MRRVFFPGLDKAMPFSGDEKGEELFEGQLIVEAKRASFFRTARSNTGVALALSMLLEKFQDMNESMKEAFENCVSPTIPGRCHAVFTSGDETSKRQSSPSNRMI